MAIRGMFDFSWVRAACEYVRSERVSLIHSHEFSANTYGTLVAALVGIPIIATVHGKNYYSDERRRRLAYSLVSRCAQIVAVSEDLKRFLMSVIGIRDNRIKVVYNGQKLLPVIGAEQKRLIKERLGLFQNEQVVGSVGNLYPVKGYRYLIAAAQKLIARRPNTTFVIIGRGELEAPLREEVKLRGLERKVRFLGFREDVPALLSIMDVFVLPSLSEGLSIALLEAMAAGKPILATQVGGNSELLIDGQTGLLVPAADVDALVEKISCLLADKYLARYLGENARKSVQQRFSEVAMIRNYEQLYDSLLQ